MLRAIEKKAARAARKTGFAIGGGLFFAVGTAFLTAAAWIYIAAILGTLQAALIIGAVYVGFGFIFMGLASSKSSDDDEVTHERSAKAQHAQSPSDQPPLMQAFLFGMQAGMGAQRGRNS